MQTQIFFNVFHNLLRYQVVIGVALEQYVLNDIMEIHSLLHSWQTLPLKENPSLHPSPSIFPLPSRRPPLFLSLTCRHPSFDPPSASSPGSRNLPSPLSEGDRDWRWSNLGLVALASFVSLLLQPSPSFLLPDLHPSCWSFCCSSESLYGSFLQFSPPLLKTWFVSFSR